MKIFASTLGIALVLALGACTGDQNTTAPGAVSGKCCSTSSAEKKACCKENKAATCDTAKTDTASPGAVSGKKDCGPCPAAKSCPSTCPMSKGSDKSNG
ncbi:MAG: hypothetical protein FJ256_06700 [Phycisphaerae bacterium]|nr:hypothetical protein [Phycisphaerae bacterium]